jgi:serine/threonine protein kinase
VTPTPDSSSPIDSTPGHDKNLDEGVLIDELCLFFEDAWLRNREPKLEPLVQGVPAPLRGELLRELLALDLTYRRRRGERPRAEDYLRRFPGLEEHVRQAFPVVTQPEPMEFAPGIVVDRYRIEGELGRGAFGTVFLARDLELERQVAIKIPGGPHTATPGQIGQLVEEARAAAQLQHPSIVSLYDVQSLPDGRLYAVMKYVEGRSLREQLTQERLPPDQLAEMFAAIADGLAYAHERGFVHRDLSPSNILLDEALRPLIADFGLALHERGLQRRVGEQAGSWAYMAPEQVRGETHRLDGRTDIWALGVMLYEALTERRPFLGQDAGEIAEEIQHRDPKPPRQIRREIPRTLEAICLRCLAKSPSNRYLTAGDLANDLRQWNQASERMSRRVLLAGGGGLLGCGLLWHWFSSRSSVPQAPSPQAPSTLVAGALPGTLAEREVRSDRADVLIWRGDQWANLEAPWQLPLRSGDQVRVHVLLRQPRYLYVIWLDAESEIAPVYPWSMGDWQERDTENLVERLELPSGGGDHVWTMEAGDLGMEMLLVLGRSTPLPTDFPLADRLRNLPLLPPASPPSLLRFDYEKLERPTGERHIDPTRIDRVRDPALALQQVLRERLSEDFPLLLGLAFPTRQ